MNYLPYVFIACVVLLIFSSYGTPYTTESFALLLPHRHARLNDYNGVEYVDIQPPCHHGERSCYPTVCPPTFEHDVICWKCDELIVEPQNE